MLLHGHKMNILGVQIGFFENFLGHNPSQKPPCVDKKIVNYLKQYFSVTITKCRTLYFWILHPIQDGVDNVKLVYYS